MKRFTETDRIGCPGMIKMTAAVVPSASNPRRHSSSVSANQMNFREVSSNAQQECGGHGERLLTQEPFRAEPNSSTCEEDELA